MNCRELRPTEGTQAHRGNSGPQRELRPTEGTQEAHRGTQAHRGLAYVVSPRGCSSVLLGASPTVSTGRE